MIKGKSVLCVIPARAESKGLPGKNIKELCGKPLVAWPIEAAQKSNSIDEIVVSTDSEKITKIAKSFHANVPFIRPAKLAQDSSTTFSVIEHAISYFKKQDTKFDYVVCLEPTSPLTTSIDVDVAINILEENRKIADSIVGVCKVENAHPVFDARIRNQGLISPYQGDEFKFYRRQDIEELYYFEGSLYISDINVLLKEKCFYHNRTLPYKVPRWKAIEIDEMVDFICAEAIINNIELLNKDNIHG